MTGKPFSTSILTYISSKSRCRQWFVCHQSFVKDMNLRRSHPEVFLGKGVLNICSKFTGEHPCQSAISIKLLCNFIEIALRHGCSPVNLLHIFRTFFLKNTSGWLLQEFETFLLVIKCQFLPVILYFTYFWPNISVK